MKYFNPAAGSIETLTAWRMWNDEVVAMGRKTENRRGASSALGVARRTKLAVDALIALQSEIAKCPPIAREILACRDMLLGIAHAIALEDEQCLKEACEVVVLCAQECGTRAGDAIVGCPKLLNGLCRKAMHTEDPAVIDALTALSHQNDKMLWVVTTIIKVMRVERKCGFGSLRRSIAAWKSWKEKARKDRIKNTIMSVSSSSAYVDDGNRVLVPRAQASRMCDVQDYLHTISAHSYVSEHGRGEYARGVIFDQSMKSPQRMAQRMRDDIIIEKSHRLESGQKGTFRIRDDIIIEPSAPSASSTMQASTVAMQPSSLYSSWNTTSTPLYSTWCAEMATKELSIANQIGLVQQEQSQPSSSSSLSLPSPEDSFSTSSSLKMPKEEYHNPDNVISVTDRLLQRSQQLSIQVDSLRGARKLPEAKILPDVWIQPEDQRFDVKYSAPLMVPPDSLLFASRTSNTVPSLFASWNGSSNKPEGHAKVMGIRHMELPLQPVPFAWRGAESNVPRNEGDVFHGLEKFVIGLPEARMEELRSQATRPSLVYRGRTPSAPPCLSRTEPSTTLTPGTLTEKQSVCDFDVVQPLKRAPSSHSLLGSPVARAITPAWDLPAPLVLPPLNYVEPEKQLSPSVIHQSSTIQVPIRKVAPGSVCDVDPIYAYFSRGRHETRQFSSHPRMPIRSETHVLARSISPMRSKVSISEVPMRPSSPSLARPGPMSQPYSSASLIRQESPPRTVSPSRGDHQRFHELADEFAFQRVGVGAMMARGQTPPRSAPVGARDVSPPATRSIVGASTIQFANVVTAPQSVAAPETYHHHSPLRHSQAEMCDVDEASMQTAFVGYTGPTVTARDWMGPSETAIGSPRYVPAEYGHVDEEDDWC